MVKRPGEPSVVVHVTIINPLRKVKKTVTGSAFARTPSPASVMEAAREALKEASECYAIERCNYCVPDHPLPNGSLPGGSSVLDGLSVAPFSGPGLRNDGQPAHAPTAPKPPENQ